MVKQTRHFRLFQLLKSGTAVEVGTIASAMNISTSSVAVYIHKLTKKFKAKFESVKDGNNVTAYKLVNASEITVPEFRKGSKSSTPKTEKKKDVVAAISTIADDLDVAKTDVVSERELADTISSLSGFGGGSTRYEE
jgi:hypothetical protein